MSKWRILLVSLLVATLGCGGSSLKSRAAESAKDGDAASAVRYARAVHECIEDSCQGDVDRHRLRALADLEETAGSAGVADEVRTWQGILHIDGGSLEGSIPYLEQALSGPEAYVATANLLQVHAVLGNLDSALAACNQGIPNMRGSGILRVAAMCDGLSGQPEALTWASSDVLRVVHSELIRQKRSRSDWADAQKQTRRAESQRNRVVPTVPPDLK